MKVRTTKALRFEGANLDLPVTLDGVSIWIVEVDNRLRLMLEIREDCTSDNLRGSYWIVNEWRKRLLEYQGRWVGGGDNELLERLSMRQEGGQSSWAEIAELYNQATGEDNPQDYVRRKIRAWRDRRGGVA